MYGVISLSDGTSYDKELYIVYFIFNSFLACIDLLSADNLNANRLGPDQGW